VPAEPLIASHYRNTLKLVQTRPHKDIEAVISEHFQVIDLQVEGESSTQIRKFSVKSINYYHTNLFQRNDGNKNTFTA
jgi:hypothetical protein